MGSYSELLDGEEHWLEVGLWPGWVLPHSVTVELVRQVTSPVDPLEVPVVSLVSAPMSAAEVAGRFSEDGWPQLSIMLQKMCELLEVPLVVEQIVRRDASYRVVGKWHKVHAGARSGAGALDAGALLDADEIAALTEGL